MKHIYSCLSAALFTSHVNCGHEICVTFWKNHFLWTTTLVICQHTALYSRPARTHTHTPIHTVYVRLAEERDRVKCETWTKLPSLSITINKPDDDGFNNNNSNSLWVLFQITVTALATSPTEKWKARCLESSSSLPLLMGQIGRQSE